MATLLPAVVFAPNAPIPRALFCDPVVFASKELEPTATFDDPVVFSNNA